MNEFPNLVDMEVRLLVLRHGERAVLEALARRSQMTLEDLDEAIRRAEERGQQRSSRARSPGKSLDGLIEGVLQERKALVRRLVDQFLAGAILQTTKELAVFFEAHGQRKPQSSKKKNLPALIRLLGSLPAEELERLIEYPKSSAGGGDFLSFAQHITAGAKPPSET